MRTSIHSVECISLKICIRVSIIYKSGGVVFPVFSVFKVPESVKCVCIRELAPVCYFVSVSECSSMLISTLACGKNVKDRPESLRSLQY